MLRLSDCQIVSGNDCPRLEGSDLVIQTHHLQASLLQKISWFTCKTLQSLAEPAFHMSFGYDSTEVNTSDVLDTSEVKVKILK